MYQEKYFVINFIFYFPDGTYTLDINIPETYPFNPPKVSLPMWAFTVCEAILFNE